MNATPQTIHLSNQYVWLPNLSKLPAQISFDVVCNKETDEFLPCFSYTKAEWDSSDCDALSWYLSPHRDDFTFRTQLFRNFPVVERLAPPFRPQVGVSFTVTCLIGSQSAVYAINGKNYAVTEYQEGDVPREGYFGFAVYENEDIDVSNIQVHASL